jgi:two-component system, OmpR family, sensor histidine kinase CiaH
MADSSKKGLGLVTLVFWVLLLYIIAALAWWFISLEKQNDALYALKKQQVNQINKSSPIYREQSVLIEKDHAQNTKKYIGEGGTFLLLIIFGAVYIYRLVRRQFRLQQQQQNFMMAITHELKTPITVARLNLETIQKRNLPEEKQKKLMNATMDETLRLDTLINNILISSQLDGNEYRPSNEKILFSEMVLDVLSHFKARYHERVVFANVMPEIILNGDPLLLKLLVSNLLENANKYSPKSKPVNCTLVEESDSIVLEVTDEGIGISDEEKKRVFSKFYRVGNEQTRKKNGTGLGLFICKKIAQAHNAAITINDNPGGGTSFIVSFKPNYHE